MTTAFVLSGGGSLGAVQVGMLQALAARGESPELLVGTSAGAINATYMAGMAPAQIPSPPSPSPGPDSGAATSSRSGPLDTCWRPRIDVFLRRATPPY